MKKLFISCPMKDRSEESIRTSMEVMHRIAELKFGQELEVIPSYIEDDPPVDYKEAVFYLGESIKKLSGADYFIGVNSTAFSGCHIESQVARLYGIESFLVPIEIMPDAEKIADKLYKKRYSSEEDLF